MKRSPVLSKTDYKTARSCPAKLYYRMHKYPSNTDGDEYMELLAEGGYMIGAIAGLLFPGAILVGEPRYTLRVDPKEVHGEDFTGETFRVLKDKEVRLYGEYRMRRLVLETWDGMGQG